MNKPYEIVGSLTYDFHVLCFEFVGVLTWNISNKVKVNIVLLIMNFKNEWVVVKILKTAFT